MRQKLAALSFALYAGVGFLDAGPALASSDYEKLNNIHSVKVISLLNDVKSFDEIHKNHGESTFDNRVRNYVIKAIGNRFIVRDNDNNDNIFSDITHDRADDPSSRIGERIKTAMQKSDVDTVIVIYPALFKLSGPGFTYSVYTSPWSGKSNISISIGYVVGIFDAKTGIQIDYGTGRLRAPGYITGYSPPWAMCDAALTPDPKAPWTTDQGSHVLNEFWSLMTRSLPYALLNAGVINETAVESLIAGGISDDPLCHFVQ